MEEPLLSEVFSTFAGGTEMDGRGFVKCLRDARLLDGQQLKAADADLIFMRRKGKRSRKIGFDEFCTCLADVSARKALDVRLVARLICDTRGPDYESGSTCASMMSSRTSLGPERLFYDKASYTGTHRKGGPSLLGGGVSDGDVVQDTDLMKRGDDARKRADAPGPTPLPMLLGKAPMQRSSSAGAGKARKAAPDAAQRASPRSKTPRGPERFFYDRSTYTGTHRNGGPSVLGNGLPKAQGYEDLKQLVDRAHVQDDALHRKKGEEPGCSAVSRARSASERRGGAPSRTRSPSMSREATLERRVSSEQDLSEGLHSAVVPPDSLAAEAVRLQSPQQQTCDAAPDLARSAQRTPVRVVAPAAPQEPPQRPQELPQRQQELPQRPQEPPQRPQSLQMAPARLQPSTSAPALPYSQQLRIASVRCVSPVVRMASPMAQRVLPAPHQVVRAVVSTPRPAYVTVARRVPAGPPPVVQPRWAFRAAP